MSCQKHLSDHSSTVGVCASCLRDHLTYLIDHQLDRKSPIQCHSITNPNSETEQIGAINVESSSKSLPNTRNSAKLTYRNRGMSPVNESEDNCKDKVTRTSQGRVKTGQTRATTSVFCFGPLVRATPNRHWRSGVGGGGDKLGIPAEIRVPVTATKVKINSEGNSTVYLSGGLASNLNRSRKLADFGRGNHHR